MKNKGLFAVWGSSYIVCLLLSFIPSSTTLLQALLSFCGIAFFLPGFLLLYRGIRQADRALMLQLRLISGLSLLLTVIVLLVNVLSITGSHALGNVLYVLLLLVSAPMAISIHWLLSLFLWACLFVATFTEKP